MWRRNKKKNIPSFFCCELFQRFCSYTSHFIFFVDGSCDITLSRYMLMNAFFVPKPIGNFSLDQYTLLQNSSDVFLSISHEWLFRFLKCSFSYIGAMNTFFLGERTRKIQDTCTPKALKTLYLYFIFMNLNNSCYIVYCEWIVI